MRIRWGAAAIVIVLVLGTLGAHWIFHVGFLVGFYWVLALITSVGVNGMHPTTAAQLLYTSLLLVVGTALWIFWLSLVVAGFVAFDQTQKERRIMDRLKKLDGHYVILGAGRVGLSIARELREANIDVVLADTDESRINAVHSSDWTALAVPSYEVEHLRPLHLERAQGVALTLPDDAQTLYVYLSVRDIAPHLRVAARARTPETASRLRKMGADEVVLPDISGGRRIARWLLKPQAHRLLNALSNEDGVRIHEMEVGPGHVMLDQPVRHLRRALGHPYTLLGYWRDGVPHMAPPASDRIVSGDVLVLVEQSSDEGP